MAKKVTQAKRNILSLPISLKDVCKAYIDNDEKKRSAERDARKARDALKNAYASLSEAMGSASFATCADYFIQRITYPAVSGSLKLKSGEEVKLTGVKYITLEDNRKVLMSEVESIYGGRSAGHKLEIK